MNIQSVTRKCNYHIFKTQSSQNLNLIGQQIKPEFCMFCAVKNEKYFSFQYKSGENDIL